MQTPTNSPNDYAKEERRNVSASINFVDEAFEIVCKNKYESPGSPGTPPPSPSGERSLLYDKLFISPKSVKRVAKFVENKDRNLVEKKQRTTRRKILKEIYAEPQGLFEFSKFMDPQSKLFIEETVDKLDRMGINIRESMPDKVQREKLTQALEGMNETLSKLSDMGLKEELEKSINQLRGSLEAKTDLYAKNAKNVSLLIGLLAAVIYYFAKPSKIRLIPVGIAGLGVVMFSNILTENSMSMKLMDLFSKINFSAKRDVNIAEPQMGNDMLDDITGACTSIMATYISCVSGKHVPTELFKNMSNVGRLKDSLAGLLRVIIGCTEKVYNWFVTEVLKGKSIRFLGTNDAAIDDYLKEIDELFDENRSYELVRNEENYTRVVRLQQLGRQLLVTIPRDKHSSGYLTVLQTEINKLYKLRQDFEASNFSLQGSRQEAVGVLFKGGPGTGKSICMEHLNTAICSIVLDDKKYNEFTNNPNSFTYNRQAENEYWDGYKPTTLVTYFDDLGQVRDVAGKADAEFMNIIRAINGFEYNLHMAHLELKGVSTFQSKFVIATTNLEKFQCESIVSNEALMRRFDCMYIVTPSKKYLEKGPDGIIPAKMLQRFDKSKLPITKFGHHEIGSVTTLNPDMQSFWKVDAKGNAIGHGSMTFDDVVRDVMASYVKKRSWRAKQVEDFKATSQKYRKWYENYTETPEGYTKPQSAEFFPFIGPVEADLEASLQMEQVELPPPAPAEGWNSDTSYSPPPVPIHWSPGTENDFDKSKAETKLMDLAKKYTVKKKYTVSPHKFVSDLSGYPKEVLEAYDIVDSFFYKVSDRRQSQIVYQVFQIANKIYVNPPNQDFHDEHVICTMIRDLGIEFVYSIINDTLDDWLYFDFGELTEFRISYPTYTEAVADEAYTFVRKMKSKWEDFVCSSPALMIIDIVIKSSEFLYTLATVVTGYIGWKIYKWFFPADEDKEWLPQNSDGAYGITKAMRPTWVPIPGSPDWFMEMTPPQQVEFMRDTRPLEEKQNDPKYELKPGDRYYYPREHYAGSESLGHSDKLSSKRARKHYVRSAKDVKHQIAHGQSGFDRSGGQLALSVFRTNSFQLEVEFDGIKSSPGSVLMLVGRVGVIPYHFIASLVDGIEDDPSRLDNTITLKKTGKERDHEFRFTVREILNGHETGCLADVDGVLVEFPKTMQPCRNIIPYFALRKDFEHMSRNLNAEMYLRSNGDEVCRSFIAHANDRELPVGDVNGHYIVRKSYVYDGFTQKGDCGAPLFIMNPALGKRKIFGIHIAGNTVLGKGYSNALCQEDILADLELFDNQITPEELENVEPEKGDFFGEGQFNMLGKATKYVPTAVTFTKIIPSQLHGSWGPALTAPAKLRPFNGPDGVIDPLANAHKKYCFPSVPIDRKILQEVKEEFGYWYNWVCKKEVDRKLLTVVEAIEGIESEVDSSGIAPSTSAGYPMSCGAPNLKKELFALEKGSPAYLSKIVEITNEISKYIEKYKKGIRPVWIFVDNLKDERRPLARCKSGSTRMFSGCPFLYLILVKMYFGAFAFHFMQNRIENGSGVGINVYSTEWHDLAMNLSKFTHEGIPNVGAGDYKAFDGSEKPEVHYAILDFINEWYDDGDENRHMRDMIWLELVNSKHIARGTVYEWCSSLPSGYPLTTIVNCLYNMFSFRYCYKELVPSKFKFENTVYLCVVGDDNIFGVHDSIKDIFNEITLGPAMSKLGLTYTTETKGTALVPFRPMTEVEFLKRGFRFAKNLGIWVAPLRLSVVLEIPYWTKRGADSRSIVASNVIESISELSLHSKEVYQEYVPKISKAFTKEYPLLKTTRPLEMSYTSRQLETTKLEGFMFK